MLKIHSILFDSLSSDPGSPAEGQVWYNSTSQLFKIYRNGAVNSFTDAETFLAHANSTSNPHSTTLEQARTAGSAFAGAVSLGGYAINQLGAGSVGTDAAQRQWVLDQITAKIQGLAWQLPIINQTTTTPPGSPTDGDRYIVGVGATGSWTGQDKKIAQWNAGSSAWDFYTPVSGWTVKDLFLGKLYQYSGTDWTLWDVSFNHSDLTNLAHDDHTQYLLVAGTRAMTGDLNMGGKDITSVGLVDGVTVSSHGARHAPGGADAIATGTPVAISTSNSAGSASSLSRSDHVHSHGSLAGGTLHSVASTGAAGFLPPCNFSGSGDPGSGNDSSQGYAVGSLWIDTSTGGSVYMCIDPSVGAAKWVELTNIDAGLSSKAGAVSAASFSGAPQKATVTFSTAFADTNYSILITCVTTNNKTFAPVVESITTSSFVIDLGSNSQADLVKVLWHAVKHGETVP